MIDQIIAYNKTITPSVFRLSTIRYIVAVSCTALKVLSISLGLKSRFPEGLPHENNAAVKNNIMQRECRMLSGYCGIVLTPSGLTTLML